MKVDKEFVLREIAGDILLSRQGELCWNLTV